MYVRLIAVGLLTIAAAPQAPKAPKPPIDQQAYQADFIHIIEVARAAYDGQPNDLARAKLLIDRDAELCRLAGRDGDPRDWDGIVRVIGATDSGAAKLLVEIAPYIGVATVQEDKFNETTKTLIAPGSATYQSALALKPGQAVKVSGALLKGFGMCPAHFRQPRDDAARKPEFLFRFTSIRGAS